MAAAGAGARRFRRNCCCAATAGPVVVLLVGGWFARGTWPAEEPAGDDATAIAVPPFRVSAAGELAYLREGMVDLLTAMLAERAGIATVSSRLLLPALQDGADPLVDGRAADVVRRLGGGRVITGEVVGLPEHLTVSATVHDLKGGEPIRVTVTGSESQLDRLVDDLAAQLLARHAGVDASAGGFSGAPLAALREYL